MVAESLQRLGGVTADLELVENPSLRLNYRTRARFHCRGGGMTGFYAPRSHDVVAIEECPLCHPRLNAALARLREADFNGDVEIVVNPESDEVLAWTHRPAPELAHLLPPPERHAAGRPCFMFDGRPVLAGAFSQSSLLLNRLLVDQVDRMLVGAESVLDLYCGNGNLSLGLPPEVEVMGMDQDRAAVDAAASVGRGTYRACSEPHFLPIIERGGWETIVLDPPRLGAKLLAPALAECGAKKIVYVSCNAATLARDLRELARGNWSVTRGVVVDLFPQTPHVETVVQLERA
jgi:23S rRNA (uracil1939-C5)-methyltransferase